MNELYITTTMKEQLKKHCSKELIEYVFGLFKAKYAYINNDTLDKHPTDYQTLTNEHYPNYWDVSEFVKDGKGNLVDKLNVIMSFIYCDGVVDYKGELCIYRDQALLVHNMYRDKVIDDVTHQRVLAPWVDSLTPSESKAYFKKMLDRE